MSKRCAASVKIDNYINEIANKKVIDCRWFSVELYVGIIVIDLKYAYNWSYTL